MDSCLKLKLKKNVFNIFNFFVADYVKEVFFTV